MSSVHWDNVRAAKGVALKRAADRVRASVDMDAYATSADWLLDWALFSTLKHVHGGSWVSWPEPLRVRETSALAEIRERYAPEVERALALQWLFDQQWRRLREEARRRGVAVWGDLPIFVDHDASDVWAAPELFRLDARGLPTVVTGAPPDDFTPEGQRWGHPHYAIEAHRRTDHAWWRARVRAILERVDTVRIDHFRGFESAWEIPADLPDGSIGTWGKGMGAPLLTALREVVSDRPLPFVAEDLGVITDAVRALRDDYALPGMAVLQFAFDGGWDNPYLPHRHRPHQVVYTGTHDNNTLDGWFAGLEPSERSPVREYLSVGDDGACVAVMLAAWRSVADHAIFPMQDLLRLDTSARMNTPGTLLGNWSWRLTADALSPELAQWVAYETRISNR
jgi:4-alpha-glucanotransferase